MWGKRLRERPRGVDDARLARAVRDQVIRVRDDRRDRSDIDHRATVALIDHPRRDRLRQQQLPEQVDLKRPPPQLARRLQKRLARGQIPAMLTSTSTTAELGDRAASTVTADVGAVGDIAGDRCRAATLVTQARGGRLDAIAVEVMEGDRGTGLGQARGDREPGDRGPRRSRSRPCRRGRAGRGAAGWSSPTYGNRSNVGLTDAPVRGKLPSVTTARDELEARLDTALEAEREIVRTLHRYAHSIDYGDEAAWLDRFTEDGVFDIRSA